MFKKCDLGQPKMYKGDARPNNVYDASDVYEIRINFIKLIAPSQVVLV